MKTIQTLVEDVEELVSEGLDSLTPEQDEVLKDFGRAMYAAMKKRLTEQRSDEYSLRMSGVGQCTSRHFHNYNGVTGEKIPPHIHMLFMVGDILEETLLTLAKLSGHTVTGQQDECYVDGVLGHRDCVIDGCLVDVKSASPYGYKKFSTGSISEGGDADNYGYLYQGDGYSEGFKDDETITDKENYYFWAIDKSLCKQTVLQVPVEMMPSARRRIAQIREITDSPVAPVREHPDEEEGKAGNRVLSKACHYCPVKHECWADANDGKGLRSFGYSNGLKHFTKVVKTPRVEEIVRDEV